MSAPEPSVSVMLAGHGGVAETVDAARLAQQAGFRRVWLDESTGPTALVTAAAIASQTRLEVGTAIVSAFTRSPALLAMAAADLAAISGGRPVHLGIGPGSPLIIEGWNGIPFRRPLAHVRDALTITRQVLSGQPTGYSGEAWSSHGYQLPSPPAAPVRLHVGAVGPALSRLAAREADGLILAFSSPEMVRSAAAKVSAELVRSGRPASAFRLSVSVVAAVTDEPRPVRESLRRMLALFANEAAAPGYARHFRAAGFDAGVDDVTAAAATGDQDRALASVPHALVDALLAAGPIDDVAARVHAYLDAGATEVILNAVPPAFGGDPATTIQAAGSALAPLL